MNLGVRAKLFLVSSGLIVVSVIATDFLVTRRIVPVVVRGIHDGLAVRLRLIERDVNRMAVPLSDLAAWDARADSLGRLAEARITIVSRDGTVLGDSDVDASLIASVENHAGRPEIAQALAGGYGTDTRYSSTLHDRMVYMAVPFGRDRALAGVVRAAVPLTSIDHAVAQFRTAILLSSLLALGVAVILSSLAATWMARPLRSLTAAARGMAAGDLARRIGIAGRDEIGQLGAAIDDLAGNLQETLHRLREDLDLREHILHDLREGVILLDSEGRVAMVNNALREMWLLTGDPTGHLPLEVTRQAEIHRLFERTRQTGQEQTAKIETAGVRPRHFLAHAAPLSGGTGGLLGVFIDVTELRRLETVRRDFVANVSHELRTPVATIRSAAETLRAGAQQDPESATSFLAIIERSAERMGRLVDDLLELSRIEAGEYRLNLAPLAAGEVVEPVLAAFAKTAAGKEIRFSLDIPASLPPVRADRNALEQVLTNLVGNAVKYSSAGARVTVRAELAGDHVRIAVADTGPGIEPQHLPRLFERFYRADAGRSRELGGTGLGLAIVRHLVEAMSGTVGVKSVPGEGSTFFFDLPVA